MWLQGQPRALRLGMVFLSLIVIQFLRPFDDQPLAIALIALVIPYAVLGWSLEPLMNTVLLLSRDRHIVGRPERLATYAFLGFAGASIVVVWLALLPLPDPRPGAGPVGDVVGSGDTVRAPLVKVLTVGAGLAAALSAVTFAGTLARVGGLGIAVMAVLLGGIAALWFTTFA
jgi:hypothetical protein